MSLALIEESAKEVRRLAIAGSPLAVGDFRIKKLIAPLEQAGAKVPVFAQVAKAISDLANGTEAESATRLLALSTLLNAILYTQGQTGTAAPFAELEVCATKCASTRTTARALKPLVAALTNSGAGRLEMIKSAIERGAFNDLRLIDPAIHALSDNYPEIADLVAEKVLPACGPGLVPRLKQGLDLKGKKSDARRLLVIHQIDPDGSLELCKKALEEGSAEVKAAAIECLGKHEECLSLVMEQANAKNKVVRAAALAALAQHDRPEVVKIFGDLIKGRTLDILAGPFRAIRNRQVLNSLLDEGKRVFDLLLKGDEEQIPRFGEILDCLKNRNDPETEEFGLACFSACEKLAKFKAPKKSPFLVFTTGADLMDRLAWLLCEIGTPRSLEAVVNKRQSLPVSAFNHVVHSALRIWPPEKVYQEFSPLLAETKGEGKQRNEILQQIIRNTSGGYVSEFDYSSELASDDPEVKWDPRWIDASIKADQAFIVCCLAVPGHDAAVKYLVKKTTDKGQMQVGLVIRTLARCGYPNVTDTFIEQLAKKTKGARYLDFDLQMLFKSARYLPAADLPKLDSFAAQLDEKFLDSYLEALAPLRPANQPNQN